MKVLIAYDGSESADTAIDGLSNPIERFWWRVCRQQWLHAPHVRLKSSRLRNGSL